MVTAAAILQEIVAQYGTPAFAYDIERVRHQVDKLRTNLPAAVEILYSLKANASLGLCGVLAECGLGADVASPGELATALKAGFPNDRIFLTGPDRSANMMVQIRAHPEMVISIDSVSEWRMLASQGLRHRAILRLRPDFCSYATCSAGPDSRFGLTWEDLLATSPLAPWGRGAGGEGNIKIVGFHIFSGSQILSVEGIVHHLRGGVDLALRAGKQLGITPEIIDLGGGFGIPYAAGDEELDLAAVGSELDVLAKRVAPGRLVLELGRYPIAQAGWYLTTVLAQQTRHGRRAVVVDGGSHQRGDMCGLGLRQKGVPPLVLSGDRGSVLVPTDVLGCLSLPGDVLAEACPLPPLSPGDVLAFPNAGAYGLTASPWLFHAHPAPAEVAFEGTRLYPLRLRKAPDSVLEGQMLIPPR